LVEESAGRLEGSAVATEVRRVRDDIERRLDGFVANLQSRALVGSGGAGRG